MDGEFARNIIIIFLCILSISNYCYKNMKKPKSKKEYIKRIELYYCNKKWFKAIKLALEVLDLLPLDIEEKITVILTIASSYYALADYHSAVKYYSKAFDLTFSYGKEYHYTECFIYALDSLKTIGKVDEAKKLFNQIISNKVNTKEFNKLFEFAQKNNLI